MTTDLAFISATDAASLYRSGKISPVEVTTACLEKIYTHNSAINAFCLVDVSAALEAARLSEKRFREGKPLGLIDGIPVAIKDLLLTKAWPTLRGSKIVSENQPWNEDSPAVARLKESGAILLGKTTTPEFGWKAVTDSPLTGITRNPWDTGKTPGGSSGGSAAALASGMTILALGSDGGGSIRIPASFTGTVGLKPTSGRVPLWPMSVFGTLAHHGPMARNVRDTAILMNVISLYDARDIYAVPGLPEDFCEGLNEKIAHVRVAYSPNLLGCKANADVDESVAQAVRISQTQGIRVDIIANPLGNLREQVEATWRVHWLLGLMKISQSYPALMKSKDVDPGLIALIEEGKNLSVQQILDAISLREELTFSLNELFSKQDLLITPTVAIPPFEIGLNVPRASAFKHWWEWTPFTLPFNLSRHPAISIPCGLTADGLPIGLQIVGRLGEDKLVLQAARAFETILPSSKFPGQK
ncbi:MAG: amidase [Alphaproteobacteria bacterium]